ncbi:MAG: ABC transporter ATP-binding protein [Oscillospiraceae bacterium]|jgi:ABC-2 type transport system ATP-binding protein|nr:ABC transporter ATP-binding protein [Oscillospiraceae bacterium]
MIEVQNLSKNYGSNKAVDDISFCAEEGEILGFLGPNGAGKSTTMNILTGYISSTSGRALIDGIDVLEDPIAAKRQIGYLPEYPPLYPDMTVDGYLKFVYNLKKCRLPRNSHLNEICDLVKISDVRSRAIRNLSKGYRQRVGLAQALVGNPGTLILDEPTVGLDPKQIIEIRSLIKKLGKNHTVIFSSHILPEIQAVCDRIVVINKGRIVANEKASTLAAGLSENASLRIRVEGSEIETKKLLGSIHQIKRVIPLRETEKGVFEYEIEPKKGEDVRREIFKKLSSRNYPLLMMKSNELTLEEVFLKLVTGDIYGNMKNKEEK